MYDHSSTWGEQQLADALAEAKDAADKVWELWYLNCHC